MTILLIAVMFGLVFAFFATQNTTGVPVQIAGYEWTNIPLYLVALGSLLLGLAIAWILSLFDWMSSVLTISGKDSALRSADKTIQNLDDQIHKLELENARLRGEKREVEVKEHFARTQPHVSFFDRLRHGLST